MNNYETQNVIPKRKNTESNVHINSKIHAMFMLRKTSLLENHYL